MKVVFGGGLGGLSAAHYLAGSCATTLVEQSPKLGGWMRTERAKDGTLLETGPHTIRPAGPQGRNTLQLVAKLGLAPSVLPILRTHPAATTRLIFVSGKLYPLPSSIKSLFVATPPFKRPFILSVIKDLFAPRSKSDDESAYDFICRRFGKEAAEYMISPMLCGICAGDAKEISIKSLLPTVHAAEQQHGSVVKGFFKDSVGIERPAPIEAFPDADKWSCWTLKTGMSSLIAALEKDVREHCSVHVSTEVKNLDLRPGTVECDIGGKRHNFRHAISAVPAKSLSKLVSKQHPILADMLSEIEFATVAVVNLVYEGEHIKKPAFGFLVPPSEGISLLGVIYDSCIMPQGGKTILTAMLGGRWFNKHFGKDHSDEHIKDVTLSHLDKLMGIKEKPLDCLVNVHRDCIAQYTVGHAKRVETITKYISNNNLPLSLVGSSYFGVGVNDVIQSAKLEVEKLLDI